MTRTALFIAVLLSSILHSRAADLLRCHTNDAVNLGFNGFLQRNLDATAAKDFDGAIVDLSTGVVRRHEIGAQRWIILQKGDDEDDAILAQGERPANYFLRVRQWKGRYAGQYNDKILFLLFYGGDTLVTGTCEPLN
jgi:hypothetical protein